MFGHLANGAVRTAASLAGLGTDEEIQENIVTGEENWQDSWTNPTSDGED
jgi:hypothetical protein